MNDDALNGLMNEIERMRDREREHAAHVARLDEVLGTFTLGAVGTLSMHPLRDMNDILRDRDPVEVSQAVAALATFHALAQARDVANDLDGDTPDWVTWVKEAVTQFRLDGQPTERIEHAVGILLALAKTLDEDEHDA